MSEYMVRFGFGKDDNVTQEIFLKSANQANDENCIIVTDICFARLLERRFNAEAFENSSMYYSLYCNPDMLKEVIEWINNLNSGVKVTFLKSKSAGCLVSNGYDLVDYRRVVKFKEFKLGEGIDSDLISSRKAKQLGLESFPISRCAVKIEVKSESFKAKALVEYITMILIRLLDYKENFLKDMSEGEILVEKMIYASNKEHDGHSLCLRLSKNNFFVYYTIELQDVIDVLNVNKIEKGVERVPLLQCERYRQTNIFNLILKEDADK
jgi:hypothetical protein